MEQQNSNPSDDPNFSKGVSESVEKLHSEDIFRRIKTLIESKIDDLDQKLNLMKNEIERQRDIRMNWLSIQFGITIGITALITAFIINILSLFHNFNNRIDRVYKIDTQCVQPNPPQQVETNSPPPVTTLPEHQLRIQS